MSCVMAAKRLAWCPREHTRDPDVEDDRVQEKGALQPRLVPLRVHEGVHGPVQELLVEQDAVDVLHCGSTQNTLFGPESTVLSIVFHPSSVLVTVREKIYNFLKTILPGIIMVAFPELGVFGGSRLCVAGNLGEKKKLRLAVVMAAMVFVTASTPSWLKILGTLVPPICSPIRSEIRSRGIILTASALFWLEILGPSITSLCSDILPERTSGGTILVYLDKVHEGLLHCSLQIPALA